MLCILHLLHYKTQNWNKYWEPSGDMVGGIHFVLVDREDHRGDDTEMLGDDIDNRVEIVLS